MTVFDCVVGALLVASVVAVVGIVSDNGFLIDATSVILGVGFFGLVWGGWHRTRFSSCRGSY